MALSQKHRSGLYQHLAPIVGEEEAEALLSQFPSRDLDEPVTKEYVRAEISGLRAELTSEISGLRAELTSEISGLRAELTSEIAGLRAELTSETSGLRAETRSEISGLRAEMHRGFADLNEKFRQQTIWIASATVVAVGIAAGLGRL